MTTQTMQTIENIKEKAEVAGYTITATVKDHGVRNGVKQTVIQRPKAVKELATA